MSGAVVASEKFQSTLPRGERQITEWYWIFCNAYFNPRSREGSDETGGFYYGSLQKFQSTLPRGERQRRWNLTLSATDFNPRSREGSDCSHVCAERVRGISIHAPARGATKLSLIVIPLFTLFQSTLPRGERHTAPTEAQQHRNFNPRSREGSDASLRSIW